MISFLQPLPIGNAVRVILTPPASAVAWRVLRKLVDVWTDQNDPAAADVYDGAEESFIDAAALTNGTPYYYKPFYQTAAGAWSTAPSLSATPAATANLIGADPLEVVRQRLELALKAAVSAGDLVHDDGYVPCLTAPPTYEGTHFPVVTVHLQNVSAFARGLGDMPDGDYYDPTTGEWTELEGWLSSVQLNIVGWVIGNGDTRIALRREIAKALLGNLAVFADQGVSQVEFTQSDIEDLESYNAAVFQTITSLSCVALLAVDAVSGSINTVSAALTA